MENNSLQHHGILGMKWGIRRYQTKNGSLTKAGQRRYAKDLEKAKAEQKQIRDSERTKAKLDKLKALQDDNAARKKALKGKEDEESTSSKSDNKPSKHKKPKQMTDDELREKIARLELEKRYKELSKSEWSSSNAQDKRNGREYTHDILRKIGENTLTNVGTQAANHAVGTTINKVFKVKNDDVLNRIVNPQKGQSDKK